MVVMALQIVVVNSVLKFKGPAQILALVVIRTTSMTIMVLIVGGMSQTFCQECSILFGSLTKILSLVNAALLSTRGLVLSIAAAARLSK